MVECYSALYEEGEVEHINVPTHPLLIIIIDIDMLILFAIIMQIFLGRYYKRPRTSTWVANFILTVMPHLWAEQETVNTTN